MNRTDRKIVSAAFVALALAYPLTGVSQTAAPASSAAPHTGAVAVSTSKAVQGAGMEVSTNRSVRMREGSSNKGQQDAVDSVDADNSHKTSGTIVATLVLMCAIAIRRHRSGKH